MSTRINHNLLSLGSQRAIWTTQNDLDTAVQRLSTGLRINYAWDDPTGLGISERLRASIAGMQEGGKERVVRRQHAADGRRALCP